jgi:uncharacterized protein (AIM24 family)
MFHSNPERDHMNYAVTDGTSFPIAQITLQQNEQIKVERGAMVYHHGGVELEGRMNAGGSGGLGGLAKAVGRSMTSGESFFKTWAKGLAPNATIAIAPSAPGYIRALEVGAQQWRLNDGAFLACDDSVDYSMKRQSLGKAIFAGTGGL